MLKWRRVWEGFGVIGSGTGILLAESEESYPLELELHLALEKFTTSWKSKMSSKPY